MKKIECYYNGDYIFTTTRYNTIKSLKLELTKNKGELYLIAGREQPHKIDEIKKYKFRLVK